MPRYAIFSDVHGNAEALEAFCAQSRQQNIEVYLCCGDLVGYGADPGRCVDQVMQLCTPTTGNARPTVVLGNHDEAVVLGDLSQMNQYAARAVLWTQAQLSKEQRARLAALPLTFEIDQELLLVHGSPQAPEKWNYIFDSFDMRQAFRSGSHRLCFVGHTHTPFTAELRPDGKLAVLPERHISLRPQARYLINVGSVGQPRDRDPRGCAVIYDSDAQTLERFRFPYALEQAQQKIIDAGLPAILAERLALGF